MFGAAAIVAVVAIFVAALIAERRHRCPVCGKGGFVPTLSVGVDDGDGKEQEYHILACRSCGLRQVKCARGVERLPAEGWKEAAERYARGGREGQDPIRAEDLPD